jgi:MoaA/NifB/PqqE/SkfB family radical SAM enzyme
MLHNTLQFFITNKCDKRCKGCFYASSLGAEHMGFDDYRRSLDKYDWRSESGVKATKVILLGGEPTLHPRIADFVNEALSRCMGVTVYTNGAKLDALESSPGATVRIGVLGHKTGEKALAGIEPPRYPVAIVYMLRQDNVAELDAAVKDAEDRFDCKYFMLSSIRDIAATGSYWKDTPETLSAAQYKDVAEGFLDRYIGNLDIHVANRGIYAGCGHARCRFLNIYPDGQCTLCPFDISLGIKDDPKNFGRQCNKHCECLLQKHVV